VLRVSNMNESMPPEPSFFPEGEDENTSPAITERRDQPAAAVGRTVADRHKYDELIAVVVALFGIGALLFWVLGKSNNPMFANKPWGGMLGQNAAVNPPAAGIDTGAAGIATGKDSNAKANPTAESQIKANPGANNPAGLAPAAIAAGAAIAGAAKPAAAEPTVPDANAATTAAPTAAAPNASTAAPTAPTAASPEIVEPDVLPSATQARRFKDVPADKAIAPYVDALSSRKVLDDIKGDMLNPDQPITRAEFANLVSRAFGKPRTKPAIAFSDVAADYARKDAVEEATRTGFMTGFPDKTFKPDLKIPRYQMQAAIVTGTQFGEAKNSAQSLAQFPDGKEVPNWAIGKVATAIESGVLPGKGISLLEPTQPATRGEAIFMLHEALVKEGKLPAVK
jgi:hypothetical protein